jgi:hypothetical protein
MTHDPRLVRIAAGLHPLVERVRTDVTAIRKANGAQAWTDEPLTDERLIGHLNGGPPRGVCPIEAGESVVYVAVLDFDSHGGEIDWPTMSETVARVAQVLQDQGYTPILFRSGGGRGVHLYLLWNSPQDAYSVREMLREVLAACGLKSGTRGVSNSEIEIYPKQNEVSPKGFGNQFILPGARASVPLEVKQEEDPWW